MKHHTVAGGGGVPIHVVETGRSDGAAIFFIHGWSQSHFCWHRQLASPELASRYRLVAIDLRGHGESGKPQAGYDEPDLWAADIAAVLESLDLRPVIAGWSYGGYVIADYVRHHGSGRIAAINFIDASTDIGGRVSYRPSRSAGWDGLLPAEGSTAPNVYSEDVEAAFDVMSEFLRRCFLAPLPYNESLALLATNLAVPPRVRRALFNRKAANDDVLRALDVPVLVTHGNDDVIIDPATARHIAQTVPRATLSLYEACGHAPFLEHTDRFNRELAVLRESVR